jgi:hypothetical protein
MVSYCGGGVSSGGGGSSSENGGGLNEGARMICIGRCRTGFVGPDMCAAWGRDRPGIEPDEVCWRGIILSDPSCGCGLFKVPNVGSHVVGEFLRGSAPGHPHWRSCVDGSAVSGLV